MQLPIISLIPSVVEITQFIYANWPHVWWFPNWYLGVPLRFVIGPIIPFLLILIHSVLVYVSFLQAYILLIAMSWAIGSVGMWFLVKRFGGKKIGAYLAAALFAVLPFHIVLLLTSRGATHIALGIVPWIILVWDSALTTGQRRWLFLLVVLISGCLLIDISILLCIFISLIIVLVLPRFQPQSLITGLISLGIVMLAALLLSTLWYTPRFWWVLLGNPSFGGKPLANVIPFLLQIAQAILPLIFGVWVTQRRFTLHSKIFRFAVLYTASFAFLTLMRFFSDVDFWLDWIGYGLELQLGAALIIGTFLGNKRFIKKRKRTLLCILMLLFVDGFLIRSLFIQDIKDATYQTQTGELIHQTVKPNQRIFLSGSGVFWAGNSMCNVNTGNDAICQLQQVRGNRDEISLHPTWAMGAYQIREGEKAELLRSWLQIFGSTYVLVNDPTTSHEYFHDFKNLDRFTSLEKRAGEEGNQIYVINADIARIANRSILSLPPPTSGVDENTITSYVQALGQAAEINDLTPQTLKIVLPRILNENEVVSVAVTADPGWKLNDQGELKADSFGNIVIQPTEKGTTYTLRYTSSWLGSGIVCGLLLVTLLFLANINRITAAVLTKLPSVTPSNRNEEEEY